MDCRNDAELTTSDAFDREPHPLHSVVLENVFGYLDLHSLKSARAVSNLWKSVANPIAQTKVKITLLWDKSQWRCRGSPTLETFINYVEEVGSQNVFFINYSLHHWRFHPNEQNVMEFYLQCGNHIRHLEISESKFYEKCLLRSIFFGWYTPNMESINVRDTQFLQASQYFTVEDRKNKTFSDGYESNPSDESDSEERNLFWESKPMGKLGYEEVIYPNRRLTRISLKIAKGCSAENAFPLCWKEVIHNYRNLKSLSLDTCEDSKASDTVNELLNDLLELRNSDSNLLKLQDLDIFSRHDSDACIITDDQYERAMKLGLNLKKISLVIKEKGNPLCTPFTVGSFIKHHARTVSDLKLRTEKNQFPIFPPLGTGIYPKLTKLNIMLTALSVNNLQFLSDLPVLKTLTIDHLVDGNNRTVLENVDKQLINNTTVLKPHVSLTSLNLMFNTLTLDCPKKIAKFFPKLTKFSAYINGNAHLMNVFKYLQMVEELIVQAHSVSDEAIIGKGQSEIQEQLFAMPQGITQMHRLKHFSMREVYESNVEPWNITDDSVTNGFVHLHKLRVLELPKTKISKTGMVQLLKNSNISELVHHGGHIKLIPLEDRLVANTGSHGCDCVTGQIQLDNGIAVLQRLKSQL